jgi:hypothetical protein
MQLHLFEFEPLEQGPEARLSSLKSELQFSCILVGVMILFEEKYSIKAQFCVAVFL